jgi:hypothetical protein
MGIDECVHFFCTGVVSGGFVIAWLSKLTGGFWQPYLGLFFGGFSFLYLLGPVWIVLAFAAGSALAAALGAKLFQRIIRV